MAPKAAGRVRTSEAVVRSRSVLGWPSSGESSWSERMDAVECAEKADELEKNGSQALAIVGRYYCS